MSKVEKYASTKKSMKGKPSILSVSSSPAHIPSLAGVESVDQDEAYKIFLEVQEERRTGEKYNADKKVDAILDEFSQLKDNTKDPVDPDTRGQRKAEATEYSAVIPKIVHTIDLKHGHKIVFQDSEIDPVEYLTQQQIEKMTDDELRQTAIFKVLAPKSDAQQKKLVKKLRKYWKNKDESNLVNKIFSQIFGWSTAVFGVTVLPFTLGMLSGLMGQRFPAPTETSSFAFEPEWFFIWTLPALGISLLSFFFSRAYKRSQGYASFAKLENIFYKRMGSNTGVYPNADHKAYFSSYYTTNFRDHNMRVDVDDNGVITATLPAKAQREVEDAILIIKTQRETLTNSS